MAISQLIITVVPPRDPVYRGDVNRWADIQGELGLELPKDLFDFGTHYGSGRFDDAGRLFIDVLNPFEPDYLKYIRDTCELYEEIKANLGLPFDIFPSPGGIFPCGQDDNGESIWWLMKGPPDQWPIVEISKPRDVEQVRMSLTQFLTQAFSGRRRFMIWPEPFFTGPDQVQFIAAK